MRGATYGRQDFVWLVRRRRCLSRDYRYRRFLHRRLKEVA